jgi:hypothetical protein
MTELPIAGVHSMQVTGRDEFMLIVSGPVGGQCSSLLCP